MEKRKQILVLSWTKTILQIFFFLFLPSAYSSAFAGVKYLFTQIGQGAPLSMTPFVSILLVLLVYTILFGRFFCGYACAFGALGDWMYALNRSIARKRGKPLPRLSRKTAKTLSYGKYAVLVVILVLCLFGIYEDLSGWSPWEAFSLLHARKFTLDKHVMSLVLFLLILVGMFFEERFFCRFLCPMGAAFALMPVLPFFSLHRSKKTCPARCSACERNCPAQISLPEDGSLDVCGDCFQCGRCVGACPQGNIHTGLKSLAGNELWYTLLRAAVLVALFVWLGV